MKARRIGGQAHVVLPHGNVYCRVFGDQARPLLTHSAVKCSLCGKVLQSARGKSADPRMNPPIFNDKELGVVGVLIQAGYKRNLAFAVAERFFTGGPLTKRERADIISAVDVVTRRKKFLAERKNPPTRGSSVKIYGQTEKIFMRKTQGPYKGQRFVHDFKRGVQQIGFPRGTIIQTPDGKTSRLTTRSVLLTGKKDLYRNFPA